MTKLNLLGAQRVKALTEILERKFEDEINALRERQLSTKEATEELAKRKGKENLLNEIYTIEKRIEEIKQEAIFDLGVGIDLSINYRTYRTPEKTIKELEEIKNNGTDDKIAQLNRELEERKSRLWLVETLEEAQEIVNREINID